ncbi:hypothetical protein CLOM_g6282 [Closterium sp. NIES-68]|nr:hypothetical protein CLOM_g6282 [Closterium sp. NIES-68]GJP74056.1 hypothetical protein CLOP_g4698 [Closterium sp. NIES-67]
MSASSQKDLGEDETDAVCDPDDEQIFEFIQRLPGEAVSGREQLLKAILASVSGNKRLSSRTQILQGLLDCWQSPSDIEEDANETSDLLAGSIWRALCLETAYHAAAMEKPSVDCMLCFWQLTTEACRHVSSILEDHFEGVTSNISSIQNLTEQAMRLISLSAGALLSLMESQPLLPVREIGHLIKESFRMMTSSFFSTKPFPARWQEAFKRPLIDVLGAFHNVSSSALKHLESVTHKRHSHWDSESPNEADEDTDMDHHSKAVSEDFNRLVALLFRSFEAVGSVTARMGSHYATINLAWKTVVSILATMARISPAPPSRTVQQQPPKHESNYDSGPGEIDEVDLPPWSREDVVRAISMLFQHTARGLVLGAEAGRQVLEDFDAKHGTHASRKEKGAFEETCVGEVDKGSEGDVAYKAEVEKLCKNLQRIFMLTKFFQNNAIRVALLYPVEACDPAAAEDMVGLLFAYAGLLHFSDRHGRSAEGSVQKGSGLKWPVPFLVAEAMAQMLGPTMFGLVHNILTSEKVSEAAKSNLVLHIIPAAVSRGPQPNMIWRVVSSAGSSEGSTTRTNLIALEQHSLEMAEWQACGRLVAATTVLEGAASYSDQMLSLLTNNLGSLNNLAAGQHSYAPLLSQAIWPFPNQRKEGTDKGGAAAATAARATRQVLLFSQLTHGLKVFVSVLGARVTSSCQPASMDVEQKNLGSLPLWEEIEAFLFQNAVHPHPICSELARDTWCFLIRHADPQIARRHAELLLLSLQASLQTAVKNSSMLRSNNLRGNNAAGVLLGLVTGLEERLATAAVDVLMACPDAVVSDVFLKAFVRHINSSFSRFSASAGTASETSKHSHTSMPGPPKSIGQEVASVLAFSLLLDRGMAAGINKRQSAALLPVARACFGAARAATANLMACGSQEFSWEQAALLGSMLTSITAVLRGRAESATSGTSGLPSVFPNTKDLLKLAADAAPLRVSSNMIDGALLIGSSRHGQVSGSRGNQSSSPYLNAPMIDLDGCTKEKLNGATQQPLLARSARLLAAMSRTSDGISVSDVEPVLHAMLHAIQRVHSQESGSGRESSSGARMVMEDMASAAAVLLSQLFASPRTQQEMIHKPVALELLHALLSAHHLPASYSSLSTLHGAIAACHSTTGMETRKYTFIRKVLPQPGSGTVVNELMKPGWTPEEAEQQLNELFRHQQQQHEILATHIDSLRMDAQRLEQGAQEKLPKALEPPVKGNTHCIDLDGVEGNNLQDVRMETGQDAELAVLPQKIAEANGILEAVLGCVDSKLGLPLMDDMQTQLTTCSRLVNQLIDSMKQRC